LVGVRNPNAVVATSATPRAVHRTVAHAVAVAVHLRPRAAAAAYWQSRRRVQTAVALDAVHHAVDDAVAVSIDSAW
jgi:hypothetical protein